ncbi:interferon-induced protein 44-like [Stegostoma tigrinum]|uniref:interferon-induced protein 44-like n=1 Tax=Stegostoma tigrinum TaxID=3053191 RepID=UPI0028704F85|nr:interferon-induced protein 44-like [Stegostoma tigrinum]
MFQRASTRRGVIPRLTTAEQKQLCKLLGKVNFHLLYKASVHGFHKDYLHAKCKDQGSTLTVGYNESGFVFGGYRTENFAVGSVVDNKAFLFRLNTNMAGGEPLKFPVRQGAVAVCDNFKEAPNFGNSLLFQLDYRKITGQSTGSYDVTNNVLFGNDEDLVEVEVYRVEEIRDPWRNITWTTQRKQELLKIITDYKPYVSSVRKARVLLIGPVGGGKSSFINSVNSIFRGHVTHRTLVGSGARSTTTVYTTYSFRGIHGTSPPLILCDTMGLAEDTEAGMHSDDIISIIKGYVYNKYKFNVDCPFKVGDNALKTIDEKVHCVAYVIDGSKATILSNEMKRKICDIRSRINELEIPQVVLLTKVDEECPMVGKDVETVYQSDLIEKKVMEVGEQLGIAVSYILPVKNYWSELELQYATDILILSAVVQMLRFADDYFENIV